MDKILKCEDMGVNCDFVACGKTEEEAIAKAAKHAWEAHGVSGASADFEEKARWAIYDDYCDYGDMAETLSEECLECYSECYDCADECCC